MNERIRELEKQATEIVKCGLNGTSTTESFNRKKFAELIVAECMKTCDETQAAYLKHRKASDDFQDKNIYAEGEVACDTIKYKLKKQFGVE